MTHILGVWHRRWYVIAIAWLICGAGWTAVTSMPDRYVSSARIYVDMDTMLAPLMKGIAVEMNLFQQIDIMRRTLMSRPNLEKIILMTDLDLTIKNEEQKEKLIKELKNSVTIAQQGNNLFKITYDNADRNLTKRVVQAVMQIFVEGNLGASRKDMDVTQRFLRDQIRGYERQLEEAERKVAEFKRKNMGYLSGAGNYFQNMEEKRRYLAETEATINETIMVRNELRTQLKDIPQFLEVVGDADAYSGQGSGPGAGPESDTQLRVLELQQVIDALLIRYTEQHPDVVSTKKRLATLEKQLEEEMAAEDALMEANAAASGDAGSQPRAKARNTLPNPVFEQIKLQLVQQEGTIAALKERVARARKDVVKWTAMAKLVPQVEADLVRLTRDYDIVKNGYRQLRSRQESARMAQDLETKAQKIQFRIIDPPKLPLTPAGPNRLLFHTVVLLFGIGGGIAFAFVLSQINTTFSTIQRLRDAFTLPVLGRISAVVSNHERRRRVREILYFGAAFSALLVAFIGLLSIEIFGAGSLISAAKDFISI